MSSVTRSSNSNQKIKVAILGGGPGGVATAFWLTKTKPLRDRFQVTLYETGWRLGGKCASGRNMQEKARSEEHGLHMLMGCYENALGTLRACYSEWQPDPQCPFKTWTDAFKPETHVTCMETTDATGLSWTPWDFRNLPTGPQNETPGDSVVDWDPTKGKPPASGSMTALNDLDGLIFKLSGQLKVLFGRLVDLGLDFDGDYETPLNQVGALANKPPLTGDGTGQFEIVERSLQSLKNRVEYYLRQTCAPSGGGTAAEPTPTPATDPRIRHLLILADLGITILLGWIADFIHGDPDHTKLNALDFREWLRNYGALRISLDSAPIRALYDFTFGYEGGNGTNINNGNMAAGVTLRFALAMVIEHKGAPLYHMSAGMGETVFTPFYRVLMARGVDIKLFHTVTNIQLTPDKSRIGTITVSEEIVPVAGAYDPFVCVKGLDCWRSVPKWQMRPDTPSSKKSARNSDSHSGPDTDCDDEAAADATAAIPTWTHTLRLEKDFDVTVLAVPPAVLASITPDLVAASTDWAQMICKSASVATLSFQLWLNKDLEELGWTLGPTVLSGYAEPFDSWADMSFLVSREDWPDPAPKSIQYFCGGIPILNVPSKIKPMVNAWFATNGAVLWPNAVTRGIGIDPRVVTSDYYRANVSPSELYVQTPKGSVQYRLAQNPGMFGNLFLAGDWTLTTFSGGCFESAIESGLWAAYEIVQWQPPAATP